MSREERTGVRRIGCRRTEYAYKRELNSNILFKPLIVLTSLVGLPTGSIVPLPTLIVRRQRLDEARRSPQRPLRCFAFPPPLRRCGAAAVPPPPRHSAAAPSAAAPFRRRAIRRRASRRHFVVLGSNG
jgi:hypothetical protein